MNRRQFSLLAAGTAISGPLAVPARPAGTAPMRITKVKTVEVRGVASGKGPVSYTHLDVYKRQFYHSCHAIL